MRSEGTERQVDNPGGASAQQYMRDMMPEESVSECRRLEAAVRSGAMQVGMSVHPHLHGVVLAGTVSSSLSRNPLSDGGGEGGGRREILAVESHAREVISGEVGGAGREGSVEGI